MAKRTIIDTLINTGKYETFINDIIQLAIKKDSSYVCVSNVHMLMEAHNDENFNRVVSHADMATPDGMPLAKAIKFLYGIDQDRVAGMDLMPDLMKIANKKGMSIFLYGSTDEILDKIATKAKHEFPNLKLDTYSPPFRILSAKEQKAIISMINGKNPDFVFVALGCPKQEKWMSEHKEKINSCMVGLGGAFEVYADVKDRAPQWMQDNSLEWVYRLQQEPRRLWKRYLTTNIPFVFLFLKQLFVIRVLKKDAERKNF